MDNFISFYADTIGMTLLYGRPSPELIISRKHRLSFAYVEYARVLRENNSLLARTVNEDADLPIANLNALMLGTGTSITTEAIAEASRWGCNVSFVAGGGLGIHSSYQSASSRTARLVIEQAKIVSDDELRLASARRMYSLRWGRANVPEGMNIQQLMQLEGSKVKKAYRRESERTGVKSFNRKTRVDFSGDDLTNQLITAGNHVIYGLVGAVIVSIGLSPALGVVHHGHANAFVFDIADLYKEEIIIPLAFDLAKEGADAGDIRRYLRRDFKGLRLIPRIIDDIYFSLGLKETDSDLNKDESLLWYETNILDSQNRDVEF